MNGHTLERKMPFEKTMAVLKLNFGQVRLAAKDLGVSVRRLKHFIKYHKINLDLLSDFDYKQPLYYRVED